MEPSRAVTRAVIRKMQARGTFQSADRFDGRDTRDCVLTGAIEGLEEVDRGADVLDRSLSIGSIDQRVDR